MRKAAGGRALALLTWGLALHIAVIALLFGIGQVPADTLRVVAAWKEAVVAILVFYVVLRIPMGFGPRARVTSTDVVLGGLVTLATIFLLGSHTILDVPLPLVSQLFGFRDAIFFFALFYVGRAMPEIVDDPRTVTRIVAVGVVTSVIAVFEIAFVDPATLSLIGVSAYFNEFLNIGETTAGNAYGLPDNYWSEIGGSFVRRAGSTYLTSQGFAIPFLIILAAVTWRLFADARRGKTWWLVTYAVLWGGLFLTITRMTIVACGIQILAALALKKRSGALMTVVAAGLITVAGAAVVKPSVGSFIWQTLSGQTGSNASHAKDLDNGLQAVLDRPWGAGLGTADQTALRNGLEPLTFDNMYLKYADELGVLGFALFVGTLCTILVKARGLALRGSTPERRWVGGVVYLATIGIFINGLTSDVFNSPWLSYVYCWLSGSVITVAQREREAERGAEAVVEIAAIPGDVAYG